jgi:hypothetical protein
VSAQSTRLIPASAQNRIVPSLTAQLADGIGQLTFFKMENIILKKTITQANDL